MEKIRFKDFLIDYLEINNISNTEFAERIDVSRNKFQQILSGKSNLSADTVDKISFITNIPESFIYNIEREYMFEEKIEKYLKRKQMTSVQFKNKFKINELKKSKWFSFIDETNNVQIIKDILKFLRVTKPDEIYKIDTELHYKSKNDKHELLVLWLEKCYKETLKQEVANYKPENIIKIVSMINKLSIKKEFNIKELKALFNSNGIYFVVQSDIPGSKIRGAFKVHKDKPAIYITIKHRRLSDIYFTLLHELAHCKRDFNSAKSKSFISVSDQGSEKIISDINADKQAYEWMIEKKLYEKLVNKFKEENLSEEDFKLVSKSFFAYRMASDGLIEYRSTFYQNLNPVEDFDYEL